MTKGKATPFQVSKAKKTSSVFRWQIPTSSSSKQIVQCRRKTGKREVDSLSCDSLARPKVLTSLPPQCPDPLA